MNFIRIEKVSVKDSWKIRGMLFGFIIFCLLAVKFYPLNLLNNIFPGLFTDKSSCVLLNVTGIPCPFCGMSHAFSEFTKLNIGQSLYYNPSSVIFFTFLAFVCLSIFVLSIFNYKISITFSKKILIISGLALASMWILNIIYGHR